MFFNKPRQNISSMRSRSIPACIGGWNARDSLAAMDEKDAVTLDNYVPDGTKVTQRQGFVSHATGMTGNVNTLIVYSPTTGSQKVLAANGANIFDCTSAGAVGAAISTGYTSDKFQYVNMGTAGGQFIFACNGSDTPFTYDGTTFTPTTITGPTVANLIWCNTHQNRIWVGEKDKLVAWYGGTNSIGGTFTAFPLYSVAKLGGYIMGMATWTRDGGSGADDVAVFITSEGEAIVYSGTDPATVGLWSLIGVFRIGKPIGRRFYEKAGADVILITEDGYLSLSTMLGVDRSKSSKAALSDKINIAVNEAVNLYRASYGWQALIYPTGKLLIFNVPVSTTKSVQHVFNTTTNAACRFTGMNAISWCVANDKLYFSGVGTVYRADYGLSDNGANIEGDIFPAFSYFGSAGAVKSFSLAEAVFEGTDQIIPSKRLNTDFRRPEYQAGASVVVAGDGGIWDSSKWDVAVWGGGTDVYRTWQSTTGIGRSASLRVKTSTNKTRPSLVAINYIFKLGGPLR